jgi:HCOMODA/2-hydroxy-3-carboxy-muconic semialdehyde decarboxylase
MAQGRDMAHILGGNTVVLMRGHGSAAAESLLKVVRLCVYLPRNARILLHAMRLGEFKRMSEGEINSRTGYKSGSPEMQRAWEYWAKRAGCAGMLGPDPGGV